MMKNKKTLHFSDKNQKLFEEIINELVAHGVTCFKNLGDLYDAVKYLPNTGSFTRDQLPQAVIQSGLVKKHTIQNKETFLHNIACDLKILLGNLKLINSLSLMDEEILYSSPSHVFDVANVMKRATYPPKYSGITPYTKMKVKRVSVVNDYYEYCQKFLIQLHGFIVICRRIENYNDPLQYEMTVIKKYIQTTPPNSNNSFQSPNRIPSDPHGKKTGHHNNKKNKKKRKLDDNNSTLLSNTRKKIKLNSSSTLSIKSFINGIKNVYHDKTSKYISIALDEKHLSISSSSAIGGYCRFIENEIAVLCSLQEKRNYYEVSLAPGTTSTIWIEHVSNSDGEIIKEYFTAKPDKLPSPNP